jgi:hypothetical protein
VASSPAARSAASPVILWRQQLRPRGCILIHMVPSLSFPRRHRKYAAPKSMLTRIRGQTLIPWDTVGSKVTGHNTSGCVKGLGKPPKASAICQQDPHAQHAPCGYKIRTNKSCKKHLVNWWDKGLTPVRNGTSHTRNQLETGSVRCI